MGRANRAWFIVWGLVLATGLGVNVFRQKPRSMSETIPIETDFSCRNEINNRLPLAINTGSYNKKRLSNSTLLLIIPLIIACVSLAVSVIFLGDPGLNPISVIHWTGSFGFAVFAPWCILWLQILQITKSKERKTKNNGRKFIFTASQAVATVNVILLIIAGVAALTTIGIFGMNAFGQIILTLACVTVLFTGNFVKSA